jgi:hypothetical protein
MWGFWGGDIGHESAIVTPPKIQKPAPLTPSEKLTIREFIELLIEVGQWDGEVTDAEVWERLKAWEAEQIRLAELSAAAQIAPVEDSLGTTQAYQVG